MSAFIRNSKFRHVYVEPPKQEDTFRNLRLATTTGEQQYVKANTKYFAVALQGGGGPIAVVDHTATGAFPTGGPVLAGHKGAALDFDFHPFNEQLLASCSDDSTVKLWGIPPGGLTETLTEPLVDLRGHGRKVTLLRFHPTASNVLASVSADMLCKVWDVEKQGEVASTDAHTSLIQDVQWNADGSLLGTSCKDKVVRLFDPRGSSVATELRAAHEGSKSVKLAFLQDGLLATVGFTRQSQRQIKIWDAREPSKELALVSLDQAAGVLLPFFDPDTKMLYLCGKGDGNIRYYEINKAAKTPCFALSEHRSTAAGKGYCFLPKRCLNVMACETARCLKLTSQNGNGVVEPLSFVVPRKSDAFQDDIFPDCYAGLPSCDADAWLAGANEPPKLRPLNPDAGFVAAPSAAAFVAKKTAAQLEVELADAHKKIADLEAKLAAAGLAS
jgi:coronin-1B/1C/6